MISFLQGQILQRYEDSLIINVRSVGYEVFCSSNTLVFLDNKENAQLWIHTHVREDQFVLFGFCSQIEKKLFLSLIKVNGVGPKLAVKILSGASTERIVSFINGGNVKALTSLPKVGKKTAEQMILTLKGQLVGEEAGSLQGRFTARADIVSALMNLGFKSHQVEKVVNDMDPSTDLEEGIRKGLASFIRGLKKGKSFNDSVSKRTTARSRFRFKFATTEFQRISRPGQNLNKKFKYL